MCRSRCPYTGEDWAVVQQAGEEDVIAAVAAARNAFEEGEWASMSARDRGRLLRRLGDLVAENAEHLGRTESTDNGKLYKGMLTQATYLQEWFYYFAGAADKLQESKIPSGSSWPDFSARYIRPGIRLFSFGQVCGQSCRYPAAYGWINTFYHQCFKESGQPVIRISSKSVIFVIQIKSMHLLL